VKIVVSVSDTTNIEYKQTLNFPAPRVFDIHTTCVNLCEFENDSPITYLVAMNSTIIHLVKGDMSVP